LLLQQLIEIRLLAGRGLQDQHHVRKRERGIDAPLIRAGLESGTDVTCQDRTAAIIDALSYAVIFGSQSVRQT
jgi:hypothetical protein